MVRPPKSDPPTYLPLLIQTVPPLGEIYGEISINLLLLKSFFD
tara:strand:- start:79 stop:207 length:129 start_codon:yes stop_codon:yes gene_type:complete